MKNLIQNRSIAVFVKLTGENLHDFSLRCRTYKNETIATTTKNPTTYTHYKNAYIVLHYNNHFCSLMNNTNQVKRPPFNVGIYLNNCK